MNKYSFPSVIAAACALAFSVLSSPAEPEDAKPEDPKPWRAIGSGSQSAITAESRLIIQDAEAWRKWWVEHTKDQHDPENANEPPEVDFKKETVLVAALGERSTGGHMIEFTAILREGKTLKAQLRVKSPGPDDMVTMALTQPFAVIAIPKHDGPIEFVAE